MKDKKRHIDQKPGAYYPEPEVPAGNAWRSMKDMLDKELPLTEPAAPNANSWLSYWKVILPGTVILGAVTLFLLSGSEKKDTGLKSAAPYPGVLSPLNEAMKKGTPAEQPSGNRAESREFPEKNQLPDIRAALPPARLKKAARVPDASMELSASRPANKTEAVKESGRNSSDSEFSQSTGESSSKRERNDRTGKRPFMNKKIISPLFAGAFDRTDVSAALQTGANLGKEHSYIQNIPEVLELVGNGPFFRNRLKEQFEAIPISGSSTKTIFSPTPVHSENKLNRILSSKKLLKQLHAGVQLTPSLPLNGYNRYFTGTDGSKRFYTPFIPGIWVSRELKNGSEVLVKFSPYNQHFGNDIQLASFRITKPDTAVINTNLSKITGMSAGLQYNYQIVGSWSVGIGANMAWQRKALLNTLTTNDSSAIVTNALYGINKNAADWKYLRSTLITGNMEVLYSWRNIALGAGMIIPVSSVTPGQKKRPVNGQLLLRCRIR